MQYTNFLAFLIEPHSEWSSIPMPNVVGIETLGCNFGHYGPCRTHAGILALLYARWRCHILNNFADIRCFLSGGNSNTRLLVGWTGSSGRLWPESGKQ